MKKALGLLLLAACHGPKHSTETTTVTLTASAQPSASASAVDARRAVVDGWNDAHNAHNAEGLSPLYAEQVLFYGTRLSRSECVAHVRELFLKQPDFRQTIRDVSFDEDAGAVRAHFVKTVAGKDYPSYLDLARSDGGWVITAESDAVTDRNMDAMKCAQLPWAKDWPYDTNAELTGRIEKADGFNATMDVEHYFRLALDRPACMPPGYEGATQTSGVQIFAYEKGPDVAAFFGKHVRARGDTFVQQTAHHHELILMAADSITIVP